VISVIGDVHGSVGELIDLVAQVPEDVETFIQVGDLGAFPHLPWKSNPLPRPVHFIRGNHDYEPDIAHLTTPTEIMHNLIFVPSGWVEEIDGRLVGFLGGADSVDMPDRTEGKDWWYTERITGAQVTQLGQMGKLDLMITHTPPISVVVAMFGRPGTISDMYVQQAWEAAGMPPLVCGHMHKSVKYHQVRVLDEWELAFV